MVTTSMFEKLSTINVNEKIEKKSAGGVELSYLSWTYAWTEFKKAYPEATYEIIKYVDKDGNYVPYMYDEKTGYMVTTKVTADNLTYEMWLPVMDSNNRAMLSRPQVFKTKAGKEINVPPATMFDVNKTIMRCLVKNMAMFGLGLYIYAGEDLPEALDTMSEETKKGIVETIEQEINGADDESILKQIYEANKGTISSNKKLLKLITDKGKKIKGIA